MIRPFISTPPLLPGETEQQFVNLLLLMVIDIKPLSNIEWICASDLSHLLWDIQRYRRWKNAVIMQNRAGAVQEALLKTDPDYQLLGPQPLILVNAKLEAAKWHNDSPERAALNARLEKNGYDVDAINAAAFIQGLLPLSTIERFLASARNQVNVLLRKMSIRREFARRARAFEQKVEEEVAAQAKPIAAEQ